MAKLSIFRFRPTGEPLALKFECEKDQPNDNRVFLDIVQAAQNNRLSVVTGVQRVYVIDEECEEPLIEMECSDTCAQQIYDCLKSMYGTAYKVKAFQESGILYIPITQTKLGFIIGDKGKPHEVVVDQKAQVHFDEIELQNKKFPLVIVEAPAHTYLWQVLRSAIDSLKTMKNVKVSCSGIVVTFWFNFFGELLPISAISNEWIIGKLEHILQNVQRGSGKYVYVLEHPENRHLALAFVNVEIRKGTLEKRNFEVLSIYKM